MTHDRKVSARRKRCPGCDKLILLGSTVAVVVDSREVEWKASHHVAGHVYRAQAGSVRVWHPECRERFLDAISLLQESAR